METVFSVGITPIKYCIISSVFSTNRRSEKVFNLMKNVKNLDRPTDEYCQICLRIAKNIKLKTERSPSRKFSFK